MAEKINENQSAVSFAARYIITYV